jgi:hypothetical protein
MGGVGMLIRNSAFTLAALTILLTAGIAASAALKQNETQAQPKRPFSLEGAWSGTATMVGVGLFPTLDTFTVGADKPGLSGTFLCTTAAPKLPHPTDPAGSMSVTPSGQGNWVRIDTNEYAFTAWRLIVDQDGWPLGRAKYWGTITQTSQDEYSGVISAQFYGTDGTPFFPVPFQGTLASRLVEVELN